MLGTRDTLQLISLLKSMYWTAIMWVWRVFSRWGRGFLGPATTTSRDSCSRALRPDLRGQTLRSPQWLALPISSVVRWAGGGLECSFLQGCHLGSVLQQLTTFAKEFLFLLVSYKEAPKLQLPGDTYNQGWQKSTPHNEEAALNFPQFFSCVCTCMCLCMYTDTHTHIVCVCAYMHIHISGVSKQVSIRWTRTQHVLTQQTWLALL